jgi:homopolymeric O-antigen transport system ATP-binding protein
VSQYAIRVARLGKRYRLGAPPGHMLSRLAGFLHTRSGSTPERQTPPPDPRREDGWFWALRDLDVEIAGGEVLGIVGANGAGKSTFLKLLSRITAPSEGVAEIVGRVGSLLEVGTGFNYELTGRENIFLNGTMLGMRRAEIAHRFDEIVEFAGAGPFIDLPVKRYSSGMVTRLGFAIAAHLDPEILIVDEVLAVGDAAFRRKCIDKMREVSRRGGRTVLFVSHSAEAVMSLCTSAIWLDHGRLRRAGGARDIVDSYLAAAVASGRAEASLLTRADRSGSGELRITLAKVRSAHRGHGAPRVGDPFEVELLFSTAHDRLRAVNFALRLRDRRGTVIAELSTRLHGESFRHLAGDGAARCRVERCPLAPGTYSLDVVVSAGPTILDQISAATSFVVLPGRFHGDGLEQATEGVVYLDHSWNTGAEATQICHDRAVG